MTANKGLNQGEDPCKHGEKDNNPDIDGNLFGNTFDKLSKQDQKRKFDRKRCRPSQGIETICNSQNRTSAFVILDGVYVSGIEIQGFQQEKDFAVF